MSLAPHAPQLRAPRPRGRVRVWTGLAYAWEHALVGTRRAPCLRQYVAHFDIFLYVHRVPRIVWYHVDWVVLPRGPDDRKIARCVSVVGKRRGCIDSF